MRAVKFLIFFAIATLLFLVGCDRYERDRSNGDQGVHEVNPYGEGFPDDPSFLVYIIDCSCSMDTGWQTFIDEYGNRMVYVLE